MSPLCLLLCLLPASRALDPALLHSAYTDTFRLSDGSALVSLESAATESMRESLRRLLACDLTDDILNFTRALPDERLLRLLLLSVAGNFTVDQSPSAIRQQCGLVADPNTGALVLRDSGTAQSVVLEVLLIVSIVCLLRAWGDKREE